MKIAFISYEYPPDTADGGIATYVEQAAAMLSGRGHHVEVFAGSREASSSGMKSGIMVHRVLEKKSANFADSIASTFKDRHGVIGFDVMEGPDYLADARSVSRLLPEIPLVVKLHTPAFICRQIEELGFRGSIYQTYSLAKAMARRRLPTWHPRHEMHRIERTQLETCDEIAAPSHAIANRLSKAWGLSQERISCFPYPYVPAKSLLEVPVETNTQMVTFLGRLEVRKGVMDLAAAIPMILREHPKARFKFVGRSMSSLVPGVSMMEMLKGMLKDCLDAVEFCGPVPLSGISSALASTDISVVPSLWESFGLVCLESLSAARGVVCSSGSGLEELVDGGRFGVLAPPASPAKLAAGICKLLAQPKLRMQLGAAGRQHVLDTFNTRVIGQKQEASYQKAISVHRRSASRTFVPIKSGALLSSSAASI